jgi:membrane-bound lytic murein transglycosylase B
MPENLEESAIVSRQPSRHHAAMLRRLLLLGGVLCLAGSASADTAGWSYLMHRLVADGVPQARVLAAFGDPRVPAFTELQFSGRTPREPKSLYRHFLRPASYRAARQCRQLHGAAFERAERQHGVPANVVAAILHVETNCGRNTGSSTVFYRLARLAMANEPLNVAANLARLRAAGEDDADDFEARVRARARYLEDTFYPEVRASFDVAAQLHVNPVDLRGSSSGAFGFPQFLPSSYLVYAADGDLDGQIDLYDIDDAAASCARYLQSFGWKPGISTAGKRQAVWHYNRSEAYIDAVLGVAAAISAPEAPRQVKAAAGKRGKANKKPRARAQTAARAHRAPG